MSSRLDPGTAPNHTKGFKVLILVVSHAYGALSSYGALSTDVPVILHICSWIYQDILQEKYFTIRFLANDASLFDFSPFFFLFERKHPQLRPMILERRQIL